MAYERTIEPLIIYHGSHKWVNPEIKENVSDLEKDKVGPDCYTGNLFRFWVDHENGNGFHLIAKVNPKVYESFWSYDENGEPKKGSKTRQERYKNEMIEEMRFLLGEDFWCPGGEQFYFTDFGLELNKKFPMFDGKVSFQFSPDVCVHPDNEEETDWGYST